MSLLRSSKFVRYFVTFARSIVITQPKNVDRALLERSKTLVSASDERSFVAVAGSADIGSNVVERSIQRIDQDVRRQGRITRKELQDVFEEIRLTRHATSTQSLLIIRCCGNLVPEENPEVRTRLVDEIWETFEKIGVMMDVSHYNALLRVYLENEHNFSPTDFLSMLEKKGVEPNRVTFQRLIMAYCQKGNIEGATRILEFMKEKQMPVNESVFNALVVGHSQSDDMESAAGILGVMRQANIEPSGDTYTALLCGYARHGDIDNINKLLQEYRDRGLELLDKDLLDVAFTLAVNNHSEHLENVLGQLRKVVGYNQDAKNVILRLIVRGEDEAAIKVFRTMLPPTTGNSDRSGSFLIKQMVKSNRPLETILSVCSSLKQSGENEYGLHHAVEASLINHANPELSLKLLSALALQDSVCQHYYWPVLVQFGKANNMQGIYATLRQLSQEVGQAVSGETLKDYVLPYMKHHNQSILDLRQGGVPLGSAAAALVGNLLSSNNIKEATRIALQYRANYNLHGIKRSLVQAFLLTKDVNSLTTMVQILRDSENNEVDSNSAADEVLQEIANYVKGSERPKVIQNILESFLDNGIGLSNETAEFLQNSLSGEELTQEISTLLSKLTSAELIPKVLSRPNLRYAEQRSEETLLFLIDAAEKKGENAGFLKKELLMNYCRNKEVQKAQDLIIKLKEGSFEFTVGTKAIIMDLYMSCDMFAEATDMYNKLCAEGVENELDENKILKYCYLHIKNDKINEALELFKKHQPKSEPSERMFAYTSLTWKLLNLAAEKGNVQLLKELFNTMKERKFLEPNNVLLGPLIKVHIVNDDLKGALDQFEECCTLYRATPWKNDLACRFIEKEDAVSLQRLTDLSTQIHGEINSLYDLVLSFVECGRIRQARKILETPGLRGRTQRLNTACEKYTSQGKVTHLENLVEATKDMTFIDRADIYYHLLLTYGNSDEIDKAMGLWTQMQDEDVQPTDQFLATLGMLLKKHGRPVPFAIPEVKEETDTSASPSSYPALPLVRLLRKTIYAKDLDGALELKDKLKDTDLSALDRTKLLNLLVNSGRLREATNILLPWLENELTVFPRCISNLINSLAKLGDVDSLESVGKYLSKDIRMSISYINRHTHCMVQANRAQEVLVRLLEDIKNAKTPEQWIALNEEFPRGGIYPLMSAHPEYLPKVEEIALEYRERGFLDPTNALWVHYKINGNEEKTKEYWSYLKPSEKIMFKPILSHARSQQNDEILLTLLKECKDAGVFESALAVIYSAIMDVYLLQCRENDVEKVLQEALQICSLEQLSRKTLIKIKKTFEICGKEFKHTIPEWKQNKVQAEESSSSSDSDNEEFKK